MERMVALETAREAFIADLLDRKPGDEPYDWDMKLGEVEVYRLDRALAAAFDAYAAALANKEAA